MTLKDILKLLRQIWGLSHNPTASNALKEKCQEMRKVLDTLEKGL